MASAGRVLLLPKGTWVPGASYVPLDYVLYDGSSYVCKNATAGTTNPAADTSNWQKLAQGVNDVTKAEIEGVVDDVAELKGSVSNPNLLDNPWFTVNQRGVSGTLINTGYYVFDRWKIGGLANGSASFDNGKVTFSRNASAQSSIYFVQLLEKFEYGTYTLSVKVNGEIRSHTFNVNSTDAQYKIYDDGFFIGGFSHDSNNYVDIGFGITSGSSTFIVECVKLEKGSLSTLANDSAPDYATELLKCKRYFIRHDLCVMGRSISNANQVAFIIPKENMRVRPSINILSFAVRKNAATQDGFTFDHVDNWINESEVECIRFTKTNHGIVQSDSFELGITYTLSADL